MDSEISRLRLGVEIRSVAARFSHGLDGIRSRTTHDPGIVPSNLIVFLPFALVETFPFDGCREAARTMATANAFGAAHFLTQDAVLDRDQAPGPRVFHLSDRSLLLFAREFAKLFPPESEFWRHLDRYVDEYFASLDWESRALRGVDRESQALRGLDKESRALRGLDRESRALRGEGALSNREDDLLAALDHLGHRMSPLKATCAAVALLHGRQEILRDLESAIDHFHTAYQLADDLEDLESDLEAGRGSAVTWIIFRRGGLTGSLRELRAADVLRAGARSGALDEILNLVNVYYERARQAAARTGAELLCCFLDRCVDRSRRVSRWASRRLGILAQNAGDTASATASEIRALHCFEMEGRRMVLDSDSGLFFEADAVAADVIDWAARGGSDASLHVLKMNRGSREIDDAVSELSRLCAPARRLSAPVVSEAHPCGPSLSGLASVALNVSGGCNLNCDYCYLGSNVPAGRCLMSEETALRAVDLLFDESFGEENLSVVFFGGEPLLNPGVVERSCAYARERADREGREIAFHLTTNGTLLTNDIVGMLSKAGVRVLVSIDGGRETHDAHRSSANGGGTYDTIASNVARIDGAMRLAARVTVTEETDDLPSVVEHLRELGFARIHLAPVSGPDMSDAFADRVLCGFEDLARRDLAAAERGEPPVVGNFLEPLMSLETGRRRLLPCGAGSRYVSVDHEGSLYLCHRFAGNGSYVVGDVERGLDRWEVGSMLARLMARAASCGECWAHGLCGGPCFYDLEAGSRDIPRPGAARCRVTGRILELSMWLYASLPAEHRARLSRSARLQAGSGSWEEEGGERGETP